MADALVSPAVGGTLWAVSGGLIAFSARRLKQNARDSLVPMMGVLGAFVFAAQMINFAIPGTGSSGHLGGGILLSVLLGPHAAFLVMASVLTVQAFFFADGGLLSLGCNIFNLGFLPAFVAYPLLYRVIAGDAAASTRARVAAIAAAAAGLLMGAACVVIETKASGMTDLPFAGFAITMLSIHAAIGLVEGLATAAVLSFVARARPDILPQAAPVNQNATRPALVGLAVAAVALGGVASWFASSRPDGLEWSIARTAGRTPVAAPTGGAHAGAAAVQEKTAVLPDYAFRKSADRSVDAAAANDNAQRWPAPEVGTSVSGIVGGLVTLSVTVLAGLLLTRRRRHV